MVIERINKDIFRIEISLPNSPLKTLNAYFVRGHERNLLVDVGFNHPASKEDMEHAMHEIGFAMEDTDIVLTHFHADHTGMTAWLAKAETRIYASDYTKRVVGGEFDGFDGSIADFLMESGLSSTGLVPADAAQMPGRRFRSEPMEHITPVDGGDILEVGNYRFLCVETSGHCPGHICLYDLEEEILFSGDHILGDITPNNTLNRPPWNDGPDFLGNYLENLDRISALPIKTTLPGHRKIISNCRERVKELIDHHEKRLDIIVGSLGKDRLTAVDIARIVPWNISIKSWDDFPIPQKYFSVGETLSHLTHLVATGTIKKERENGVVYYSKKWGC